VPIAVWNDVPRRVYTDTAKNEEYKPKYAGRPASSEYASAEIIIFEVKIFLGRLNIQKIAKSWKKIIGTCIPKTLSTPIIFPRNFSKYF
jgi:ADP-glucose pyrophosphorylase